jgi:hypothetical protein
MDKPTDTAGTIIKGTLIDADIDRRAWRCGLSPLRLARSYLHPTS